MSRKPNLKPATLSRDELLERRVADLERMLRRSSARMVPGGMDATTNVVSQTAHGLSVGNVIRHNGTSWVKSKANNIDNIPVGGIVIAVLSPDVFVMATAGYVAGLSGLTPGVVHYLSDTTDGLLVDAAPDIWIVPVLLADTETSGVLCGQQYADVGCTALSVLGRYTNNDGPAVSITSSMDGDVLKRQGDTLVWGGLGSFPVAGVSQSSTKAITSDYTFTPDPTQNVWVMACGGGGGGGDINGAIGGGGGASGWVICTPVFRFSGSTTITVSAVGAAGTAGSASAGGSGGSTTFAIGGITFSAPGGGGGQGGAGSAGYGGTPVGLAGYNTQWRYAAAGRDSRNATTQPGAGGSHQCTDLSGYGNGGNGAGSSAAGAGQAGRILVCSDWTLY